MIVVEVVVVVVVVVVDEDVVVEAYNSSSLFCKFWRISFLSAISATTSSIILAASSNTVRISCISSLLHGPTVAANISCARESLFGSPFCRAVSPALQRLVN